MEEELEVLSLDSRELQIKALRSGSTRLRTEALKKIHNEIGAFGTSPLTFLA